MNLRALVVIAIMGAGLWKYQHRPSPQQIVVILPRAPEGTVTAVGYRYDAPPSISKEAYVAIICEAGPACDEAGSMYDVLVAAGLDPVVEAAQAQHETQIGVLGIGQLQYKNLHGVQCHDGDGRIADSKVKWGNGCAGVYGSYTDSVRTWAKVISQEYVAEGLNTPALAVSKYAPETDGNDPPDYIAEMEHHIDAWRAQYPLARSQSVVRGQLVAYALSLIGTPYIVGGSDSYRAGASTEGGDCSATMQHIYAHVTGINIGQSTFTQRPALQLVDPAALQPGDLWYGTYYDDEHVGMVADVNHDGVWDLINNGGLQHEMHVDYNFMALDYFNQHTIDFRTVLGGNS